MVNTSEAARLIEKAMALGMKKPDHVHAAELAVVWADMLDTYPPADVDAAIRNLARARVWLDLPGIETEIKRIRSERLTRARYEEITPNADPDDPAAWNRERRAIRDAIANGRVSDDDLARYRAGGVSITGSHKAMKAITGTPDEIESGKTAARRYGITPKENK